MTGEHKHRILILYAGYGDGHYQAAKALKETFSEHGVRDVVMADLFRQANRAVYAISKYAYIKSYRVLPSVYGWLYNGTKHLRWHKFPARRIQSCKRRWKSDSASGATFEYSDMSSRFTN